MVGYSRIEMFEFEEAVIARHQPLGIGERRLFKSDRCARNGGIIHIDHRTDNRSGLRFGCGDELGWRCAGARHTEKEKAQAMPGTHPPSSLFHIALVSFFQLWHS